MINTYTFTLRESECHDNNICMKSFKVPDPRH